jgi:hypothetical protein
MAEGEGRTLDEALDDWAMKKSGQVLESLDEDISFREGLDVFEAYHPVQISVKVRPANQWVKGFKVTDAES